MFIVSRRDLPVDLRNILVTAVHTVDLNISAQTFRHLSLNVENIEMHHSAFSEDFIRKQQLYPIDAGLIR